MSSIAPSELILNSRGAVYHLNLRPEELAPSVITVGDPERVKEVSRHFDQVEFTSVHREFVTHTGRIGTKKISVVSTGIGTDNIDIVLNELDALVNIDLVTRTIKDTPTSLQIIRLGTSGSLQADIPVDDFVVSSHGLGIDNLLHFYQFSKTAEEKQLLSAFAGQVPLSPDAARPYLITASQELQQKFTNGFHTGITVTCPGFYGPQGRVLRGPLSHPDLIDQLSRFNFNNHRIANFEMETAGIYGMGRVLGHHCLSVSAVVANRISQEFSKDVAKTMETLIRKALDIIAG